MGNLLRRRMMVSAGGANTSPKYTLKSVVGSDKTTLPLGLDYTPAFVCAWSTYRFSNSNYGSMQRCVHAVVDTLTGGSFSAKTFSTTGATPAWGAASIDGSNNLVCAWAHNFKSDDEYMFFALSADAITYGVDGHVYVEDFTGTGTKSHTTQCPFPADVWFVYNLTSFTNKAVPDQKYSQVSRVADNFHMGIYSTQRASGSGFDNVSILTYSTAKAGPIVETNQYLRATDNFRFIAIKL